MWPHGESRIKTFRQAAVTIFLLPLIIPLSVIGIVLFVANRLILNALVRLMWLPRGKDILLVYSDSPIWHEYVTNQILPLVQSRAEILNWSERNRWPNWSLAVRLFRSYSGGRDFNPMVILFPPLGKARFFRFLPAFQERKHGNPGPLEQMRQDLISRH
jgi:hypothetical protein